MEKKQGHWVGFTGTGICMRRNKGAVSSFSSFSLTDFCLYELVNEDLSYSSHLLPTIGLVVAIPLELHSTICTTFFDVHLLCLGSVQQNGGSGRVDVVLSSSALGRRGPEERGKKSAVVGGPETKAGTREIPERTELLQYC